MSILQVDLYVLQAVGVHPSAECQPNGVEIEAAMQDFNNYMRDHQNGIFTYFANKRDYKEVHWSSPAAFRQLSARGMRTFTRNLTSVQFHALPFTSIHSDLHITLPFTSSNRRY